jgi:hypothetical protein
VRNKKKAGSRPEILRRDRREPASRRAAAALYQLRVEAASAAERAALMDEFRALVRSLQEGKGRAGEAGSKPRRQTKPEG